MSISRFRDENKRLSHFQTQVLVHCPQCDLRAMASVDYEEKRARLFCINCGHIRNVATIDASFGQLIVAAHAYFNARLWLQAPFRNDTFWAYNHEHLLYLENYISAKLRESNDRTHFTLLEKLPKFYHEAKNREALLKLIEKLKKTL